MALMLRKPKVSGFVRVQLYSKLAVFLVAVFVLLASFSPLVQAAAKVKNKCPRNCYPMLVMRVIDGDSVLGYIHTNDQQAVIYATLRLEGIDTPETGRRAQCVREELRGLKAKLSLMKQLAPIINHHSANYACACDYQGGKFAKRRVGTLKVKSAGKSKWQNVTRHLLTKCLAVPYTKGKRPDWCQCLDKGNCPKKFFAKCRFAR